ncbi:glycosylated lysosomal membrane protein [Gadus chalcogrammus]|uniref:glycosylated lysosomal membrane protein n=1 Tax=Gadus chalcogrammus TaxID=1042646 RepID=UPI0024C49BDD|nr:glycosylated lysosomal membrane protein [Gadus chalcogrammus]
MAAAARGVLLLSLLVLLLNATLCSGDTYRRQLSLELNPGLNSSVSPLPPGINLIHIRSLGDGDTLHFLLCNQGPPTLLIVHTNSTSSSVQVDWPAFLSGNNSGSLRVEPENSVLHSNALVLVRLWEYDDLNDTADPQTAPPSSFLPPYELSRFQWGPLNSSTLDPPGPGGPEARLCGGDGSPAFSQGELCLQLSAFGSGGRAAGWPGLLHSANSSQLGFWLQGVRPRADRARFLLELQGLGRPHGPGRVEVRRSIDDEYSPSIFTVSQWLATPPDSSSPVLGFVQWRPVAYRRPQPEFSDTTPCHHSAPAAVEAAASGLGRAFYGAEAEASGLNISFGQPGEPSYNTTQYLSWTVLAGVGAPPVDSFSPLVISIMAVGLGTPLLLLLLGGVFVCVRKHRPAEGQAYRPIN